ncbi:methyltransferase domain-containing protein [candidate division KSB3 bacterium]|uniref:Methyltransferase domain-containing protein n=1 Tax=candidate division KSB3 bacterium TaxID=2044937 RepID=A0A9D5JSV4_9BACT|nr:methyltransferase domain-containing protein [candidate division KSB3 bacterium]MBD3323634.1 methyltransferase domain-containing protein [candidate division KSB3 bacterium]
MTRFQMRMPRETEMLKGWIARYHFCSVVDIACGTGLHAIILAQLGIQTVAADISEAMLQNARAHAEHFGVQIPWIQTSMEHARQHIEGTYDAVFCLGNSLPHLLNQEALEAAVQNFARLLQPGGLAVIQILNYQRILADQQRIIGIHRQDDTEFIRFYDFLPDGIGFNLLTIQWEQGKPSHTLSTTLLYPYQQHEVVQALSTGGFRNFEYYGDMNFQPFDPQTSSNLVIVAQQPRPTD